MLPQALFEQDPGPSPYHRAVLGWHVVSSEDTFLPLFFLFFSDSDGSAKTLSNGYIDWSKI